MVLNMTLASIHWQNIYMLKWMKKAILTQLFKGIIGHRKNSKALEKADQFRTVNARKVKKKTTSGWDTEIE